MENDIPHINMYDYVSCIILKQYAIHYSMSRLSRIAHDFQGLQRAHGFPELQVIGTVENMAPEASVGIFHWYFPWILGRRFWDFYGVYPLVNSHNYGK